MRRVKWLKQRIELDDKLIAAQDVLIKAQKDLIRILHREVEIYQELRLLEVGKY